MQIQPKPYMEKLKLRHHAVGVERRRNMSKLILEKGTPLPKPIEYSDIDQAMFNWLEGKIDLVYDGKKLPTYKLYSTQRINEYMQSWNQLDDTGNIIINFKTISRETNPQKGEINGNYFNIPGHKDFAMFYIPILQENGTEAYDKYTMKQPFAVNFVYSISIITNKMELVNKMNEKMHYEFNAINTYIAPNEHPMSMTLEDISDESEYTVDDRKYYSQTYKVKVKGYIIRREDYKVERIPSRLILSSRDSDASGIVNRRGKNRREDEKVKFMEEISPMQDIDKYNNWLLNGDDEKCEPIGLPTSEPRPSDVDDSVDCEEVCKPKPNYYNKKVSIIINFGECDKELSFVIDKKVILDTVETTNIYDFKILINDELINLDNEVEFLKDDEITVKVSKRDEFKGGEVKLIGYDPEIVFNVDKLSETVLDEPYNEEEILINFQENEENLG